MAGYTSSRQPCSSANGLMRASSGFNATSTTVYGNR